MLIDSYLKDNKYSTWYLKFMRLCKDRKPLVDTVVEKHHIQPRSLGGSDSHENLVVLAPREHYIAHLLLCKATSLNPKMIKAFHKMCHSSSSGQARDYKIPSRIYDFLRREHSKVVSEYSLNTVACFDKRRNKFLRVSCSEFNQNQDRYTAPNKGIKRQIAAIKKQEETKFPFIVSINNKEYTNSTDLRSDYYFIGVDFIRKLYNNSFKISRLTKNTVQKYQKIFKIGHIVPSDPESFTKLIYDAISVKIKEDANESFLIKRTIHIPSNSSQKSRISRTKTKYITPTGTFLSTADFLQAYPVFSVDKLRHIKNNPNKPISKKVIRFFYPLLCDDDVGKTWFELGFYILPK